MRVLQEVEVREKRLLAFRTAICSRHLNILLLLLFNLAVGEEAMLVESLLPETFLVADRAFQESKFLLLDRLPLGSLLHERQRHCKGDHREDAHHFSEDCGLFPRRLLVDELHVEEELFFDGEGESTDGASEADGLHGV